MAGTILQELQRLFATAEPPELGPGPRARVLAEGVLEAKLDGLFDRGEIASARQPLIRALVLLWHDHLDAAHVIAQSIDDADGAFPRHHAPARAGLRQCQVLVPSGGGARRLS